MTRTCFRIAVESAAVHLPLRLIACCLSRWMALSATRSIRVKIGAVRAVANVSATQSALTRSRPCTISAGVNWWTMPAIHSSRAVT